VAGGADDPEDGTDQDHDDTNRPKDRHVQKKAHEQQDDAEDDHGC
jgi:hypothetical protein